MTAKVKKSLKKFARRRLTDVIAQRRRLRPVIKEMKEKAERKERRKGERDREAERAHQAQLKELEEEDGEFINYLKQEDPTLLSFGGEEDDDEEEEELSTLDDASEDGIGGGAAFLEKTRDALCQRFDAVFQAVAKGANAGKSADATTVSRNGLRDVVTTLHEAVQRLCGTDPSTKSTVAGDDIDDLEEDKKTAKRPATKKKSASSEGMMSLQATDSRRSLDIYIVESCVRNLPAAFNSYLQRVPRGTHPKKCPRYHTIAGFIRSYVVNVGQLIRCLSAECASSTAASSRTRDDASLGPSVLLECVVHHTALLGVEYIGAHPIPVKRIIKAVVQCVTSLQLPRDGDASSGDDDAAKGMLNSPLRSACAALLRSCARSLGATVREQVFKGVFQSYISVVRQWAPSTATALLEVESVVVELYGVDLPLAYQTLFGYLKQLAICLRTALLQPDDEIALRTLHNWKYVHALKVMGNIIAAYATADGLAPLVYPLCQICLGVLDVFASPRAYPFNLHVLHVLTYVSECANTTVPLTPYFLRILSNPQFVAARKKGGKQHTTDTSSFAAPGGEYRLSFMLRTNKAVLKSPSYLTAVLRELLYLIARHTTAAGASICFPEQFMLLHATIRRIRKQCARVEWSAMLQEYTRKVDLTEEIIRQRRRSVSFGPCEEQEIENWERNVRKEYNVVRPLPRALIDPLPEKKGTTATLPIAAYFFSLHRRREEALQRLVLNSKQAQEEDDDDDDDEEEEETGRNRAADVDEDVDDADEQKAGKSRAKKTLRRRTTLEDIVGEAGVSQQPQKQQPPRASASGKRAAKRPKETEMELE